MSHFVRHLIAGIAAASTGIATALAQPPVSVDPASTRGQFIVLPIFDPAANAGTAACSSDQLQAEMTKLKVQVGENHGKFRIGFSHIVGSPAGLREHCRLARANNLSVGVIIGVQTHTGMGRTLVTRDFRNMQWRLDGVTYEGEQKVSKDGNPEFPARDWQVPTPSRLCADIHSDAISAARRAAETIAAEMKEFPGTIVAVNASIEEELATGGEANDNFLADYSPYAVAEFRDWLRHTGIYDDTGGVHHGEGAPESITGPFARIKGALRSPFYDAPSPDVARSGVLTFNERFGTAFTTWSLRSWDLDRFPEPITDSTFSPMPAPQTRGCTIGGFDAPRKRDPMNAFWRAWSWDVYDQDGKYPPGNPARPAFGFRQVEIAHFVEDILDEARKAGVPPGLLYAHQIPSEQVSPTRNRSGASPIWTGFYAPSGTLGITRFGPIDPKLLSQYSRDWGIFEWHPKPYTTPDDPALYKATLDALDTYSRAGGHLFFAGWWKAGGDHDKIFPLNDSAFARALHDWIGRQ